MPCCSSGYQACQPVCLAWVGRRSSSLPATLWARCRWRWRVGRRARSRGRAAPCLRSCYKVCASAPPAPDGQLLLEDRKRVLLHCVHLLAAPTCSMEARSLLLHREQAGGATDFEAAWGRRGQHGKAKEASAALGQLIGYYSPVHAPQCMPLRGRRLLTRRGRGKWRALQRHAWTQRWQRHHQPTPW
jgi:hypothetical protein